MGTMHYIKQISRTYLSPSIQVRVREIKNSLRPFEPEIRLLPFLCDAQKKSLDIGAHVGLYTSFIRRHSKHCIAFEPNSSLADYLRLAFSSRVDVQEFALSDQAARLLLRIPKTGGVLRDGTATIEASNTLDGCLNIDQCEIECRTLDSFHYDNVGFIKIDVEGHELSVLHGATETLTNSSPNLIVEIEERHKPGAVNAAFSFLLEQLGYQGFYLYGRKLHPLVSFSVHRHQDFSRINDKKNIKPYINNFIFIRSRKYIDILNRADLLLP